jgi:hypothetical protein
MAALPSGELNGVGWAHRQASPAGRALVAVYDRLRRTAELRAQLDGAVSASFAAGVADDAHAGEAGLGNAQPRMRLAGDEMPA